jgi:hypothetical protein
MGDVSMDDEGRDDWNQVTSQEEGCGEEGKSKEEQDQDEHEPGPGEGNS